MKLRFIFAILFILLAEAVPVKAQHARILHYSETSGFDHNTRANSLALFQSFSNVTVVNDVSGAWFDSLSTLLDFDLVVFSNTSGDAILDSLQRHHFEIYMQNGGSLMGIHAASDTYRHSSANGNHTGTWDFFAETLGGSVQQNPNHVAGTPLYSISTVMPHYSVSGLPNPWPKNEEYYYWENGFLDSANQVVLEVEETVGPNGQVNSYDSSRAVSWFKTTASGGSVFYTSMGHANSNFVSDSTFIQHIQQATDWCLGRTINLTENDAGRKVLFYPNPTEEYLYFRSGSGRKKGFIRDLSGSLLKSIPDFSGEERVYIGDLPSGFYLVEITGRNFRQVEKLGIQ